MDYPFLWWAIALGGIAMVATRSGSAVRAGGVPCEIKAVIQWRSVQWLREIGVRPTGGRFAIALPVAQAHVPFADHTSAIPHVAQHGRYCGTIRLDQGITLCAEEHPPFHPTAPRVTTGEQSITRGRAAAGRRVRVGGTHPHSRESLHLRRVQLHGIRVARSEEHTSELQSLVNLVCRLLLEKKNKKRTEQQRT